MTEDTQLLGELAKLIGRYGPEPFARLAIMLKNPEQAQQLAEVIEAVLATKAVAKNRRRPSTKIPPGSRILATLKVIEPEKYELLATFRDDFFAHRVLPSMQHVRRFAEQNEITIGRSPSREKAISPLLRSMASLPLLHIQELVDKFATEVPDDRSLARWSELIMRSGKEPLNP